MIKKYMKHIWYVIMQNTIKLLLNLEITVTKIYDSVLEHLYFYYLYTLVWLFLMKTISKNMKFIMRRNQDYVHGK